MAGTLQVPSGTHFFSDPPFSKFGTESCPPTERVGEGSDTVKTHQYFFQVI